VTLIYQNAALGAEQSGTHVLAIGVGRYPHLLGGDAETAERSLGLRQLESPPESLKAVLDWFLRPNFVAGSVGFTNPSTPLASVEALVSTDEPFVMDDLPETPAIHAATRENIQEAFEAWLARLKSHPDHIGVFYFCGHGFMVAEHSLLAEDFGYSNAQPWSSAFNVSSTIRAVEREVSGSLFFLIDSCRGIAREVALTLGADPHALLAVDLTKAVSRKSMTAIYAAGEGELAFAPRGGAVSRFTSALLYALSGYCGVRKPGVSTWNVDGEGLASAVRLLLEFEGRERTSSRQVSAQTVQGSPVPLLQLATLPKVKVWLDLLPSDRRALYELYLKSFTGDRYAQSLLNQVFEVDVPRGFYEVGAQDPHGALPAVKHPAEDLSPPVYVLTMEA
jgi:hypothetical protein